MVVPANQAVLVSPCELFSEVQVIHPCVCQASELKRQVSKKCLRIETSNRKAAVGENHDMPHAPLPFLRQYREGVRHVLQRHQASLALMAGLSNLFLWLLEEEENTAETNREKGSSSSEATIVSKSGYLFVSFDVLRKCSLFEKRTIGVVPNYLYSEQASVHHSDSDCPAIQRQP